MTRLRCCFAIDQQVCGLLKCFEPVFQLFNAQSHSLNHPDQGVRYTFLLNHQVFWATVHRVCPSKVPGRFYRGLQGTALPILHGLMPLPPDTRLFAA